MKSTTKNKTMQAVPSESKTIEIKFHPRVKYTVERDIDPKDINADTPTRPMSTLDVIETVVTQIMKGPHGEPLPVPYPEQNKIFQILSKMEDLPKDAKQIEFKESQLLFIQKRAKNFPWVRYDPFFKEFEELIGVKYDDKEVSE